MAVRPPRSNVGRLTLELDDGTTLTVGRARVERMEIQPMRPDTEPYDVFCDWPRPLRDPRIVLELVPVADWSDPEAALYRVTLPLDDAAQESGWAG